MMRAAFWDIRRQIVTAALLGVAAAGALGPAAAWASEYEGLYGAPFLRIPVGARLMTSPDVLVGMEPDASLTFSNPAFLSDIRDTELFFSTVNWLDDLRFTGASAAVPVGEFVLGFGTSFLYSGGLKGYDNQLNVTREENYYDLGVRAAVARRLGPLALGAGATAVRQHVYPDNGHGYAFTLGASWRLGPNLFHAAAMNVGGRVDFDAVGYRIDSERILGAARVFETSFGRMVAGLQLRLSDAASDRIEVGVDYHVARMLTLRAGLPDLAGGKDGLGMRGGLGVRYGMLGVEYAYTSKDYFSPSHAFSIVFALGRGGTGPGPVPPGRTTPPIPVGVDASPVVSPSQVGASPEPSTGAEGGPAPERAATRAFLILGGTHESLSSARAEAGALELLGILTEVEPIGGDRFRVVVGRYAQRAPAQRALEMYKKRGHRFSLVVE